MEPTPFARQIITPTGPLALVLLFEGNPLHYELRATHLLVNKFENPKWNVTAEPDQLAKPSKETPLPALGEGFSPYL